MKNSISLAVVAASLAFLLHELPKPRLGLSLSYSRAQTLSFSAHVGIGMQPFRPSGLSQ